MTKYKIPIWENEKDYISDATSVVSTLLALADREFQIRIWWKCEGPEVDSYDECLIEFDDLLDYLKYEIREKKVTLSSIQIKAILRVHAMFNTFERKAWGPHVPKDWDGEHQYIINHPYWIKLTQAADHALSLLKK